MPGLSLRGIPTADIAVAAVTESLAPLPARLAHSLGVGRAAERLASALGLPGRDLLVAAPYLLDFGFARRRGRHRPAPARRRASPPRAGCGPGPVPDRGAPPTPLLPTIRGIEQAGGVAVTCAAVSWGANKAEVSVDLARPTAD